jgi:hypothetical protein
MTSIGAAPPAVFERVLRELGFERAAVESLPSCLPALDQSVQNGVQRDERPNMIVQIASVRTDTATGNPPNYYVHLSLPSYIRLPR